jgi:glutamyl-tRNA reductase
MAIANRTLERGEKLASRFGGEVMRLADCRTGCTSLTPWSAAPPARCPSSAWVRWSGRSSAATAPCSWWIWPCRATSNPKSRRWTTSTSTPWTTWPGVVQTAQANRQAAVAQAEAIVDAGVQSFMHWMDQRGTVPLIQQLNAQADEWRAAEMARARKLLAKGEDVDAVLEALSVA